MQQYAQDQIMVSEQELSNARSVFMNKTYAWMVAGLVITGLTAWQVFESGIYIDILTSSFGLWGLIIAQFGIVIGINAAINKISTLTAGLLFVAFSLVTGTVFSSIFAIYTAESIQNVFFIAAGMFGGLSILGYITKKDLTAMGSFMLAGLIGIIIAGFVNVFIGSSAIYWVTTFAGVVIFAGLIAYDTQKLKEMAVIQLVDREMANKSAIVGALTLYLDFINLFLLLLRIFGDRK